MTHQSREKPNARCPPIVLVVVLVLVIGPLFLPLRRYRGGNNLKNDYDDDDEDDGRQRAYGFFRCFPLPLDTGYHGSRGSALSSSIIPLTRAALEGAQKRRSCHPTNKRREPAWRLYMW